MSSDDIPTKGPAPADRAKAERLARHQRLFNSGLTQHLLDAMPNVVLILDDCRQAVYANRRLLELLELDTSEQALGKRPGDLWDCQHAFSEGGCGTTLFCHHCGGIQAILAALEGHSQVSDCSITTRGGKRVELRVWATPLEMEGEHFTVFAIVNTSDEQRRRALEHVFFHDVLNTAGAIRGAAQLLGSTDEAHLPKLLQIISSGSLRLVDEIKAQRDLLAAESGELQVNIEFVNSLQLLQQLLETYSAHPVARERTLLLHSAAQSIDLRTDPTIIGRVLGNMLKNALEASAERQTVTVNCSAKSDDGLVAFTVHNVSVMPQPVQMKVFDRSFSTKGPGRGLGTYSIKLLAERYLDGHVSFTSTDDDGTTFLLRVPREL